MRDSSLIWLEYRATYTQDIYLIFLVPLDNHNHSQYFKVQYFDIKCAKNSQDSGLHNHGLWYPGLLVSVLQYPGLKDTGFKYSGLQDTRF